MQYKKFFKSELKNLKEQGLYRDFRNIDRPIKSFPNADESFKNKEREVEVWCSNDYLNMSQHPEVVNEIVKTHFLNMDQVQVEQEIFLVHQLIILNLKKNWQMFTIKKQH